MKDVHYNPFQVGQERSKKLNGFLTDNPTTVSAIFPWPEVKMKTSGGKELVTKYPGSIELIRKLGSDDPTLWPKVEICRKLY